MVPEIKAEWVAALRSGKFAQGKNYLRCEDNYCCLGVLCEIAVQHGVIGAPDLDATKLRPFYFYGRSTFSVLPLEVSKWSGVGKIGQYRGGSLADDNDRGKTFSEIADIIERKF